MIDREGVIDVIAKLDTDIRSAFASWQRLEGAKIAYQRILAEIDGTGSENGVAEKVPVTNLAEVKATRRSRRQK
jgi:hypothetical protein